MTDPLIAQALDARERAYAKYSEFHVGCAIEGADGTVVQGANVENVCYRLGVCAEQSALSAAQIAFGIANVRRIAVVGGFVDASKQDGTAVMPCGGCRQAIAEAAREAGHDIAIVCADHAGENAVETTISALLPHGFDF
ncbi:cytidine deaminase [Aurantiacibacter gangjinensis]|uniref:Uncharacterized protein n=1 Tax=Aurantiacibacter gangjinensis TaxID=502682 RepID=A0A0G9MVM7_9SPHN|nr:cytidine deaminase [Aurantiacibacter gangjinensis]APE26867.1 Cytidine deaminase [Aurantiacibacter gangjinensis]KLE33338.1 hypothetical protein AAW01_05190 [Aurantiacibacter gangjinensis]